jgi:hypothetical protein
MPEENIWTNRDLYVIDLGPPGPDRGKGGKYLILPPDYEGDAPEGYFTAKSTSYVNWMALRGFAVDGKPDASTRMFNEGLKIYPRLIQKIRWNLSCPGTGLAV